MLAWIADELLPLDTRLLTKSGRLKGDICQPLSEQIVETLPDHWLAQWASVAERPGPAAQWWRQLVKHAIKTHRKPKTVGRLVSRLRRD